MTLARLSFAALFVVAAVGAYLMSASLVQAHARLKESTPTAGEVLAASPAEVSITFTQDVQKLTGTYGIDVVGADGTNYIAAPAVLNDDDRAVMTVQLQPALPSGRYVASFTNVSDADGDPFAGGFAFYVGREPTADERAADAELAAEQEEETPTATEPAPTVAPPSAVAPTATPAGAGDDEHDDGGSTATTIAIVAGAVVAGVAIGFVGWRLLANRRG